MADVPSKNKNEQRTQFLKKSHVRPNRTSSLDRRFGNPKGFMVEHASATGAKRPWCPEEHSPEAQQAKKQAPSKNDKIPPKKLNQDKIIDVDSMEKETEQTSEPSKETNQDDKEETDDTFTKVEYKKKRQERLANSYRAPREEDSTSRQVIIKLEGMPGSLITPAKLAHYQITNILKKAQIVPQEDIREIKINKRSMWVTMRLQVKDIRTAKLIDELQYKKEKNLETTQAHWKITLINSSTVGVIKGIRDENLDIEALSEWITEENEDANIDTIRQMGQGGTTFMIKFNSPVLPEKIKTPFGNRIVYNFVRSNPQCRGCLKFGHTVSSCTTKTIRCTKCGGEDHKIAECKETNPKCIHCQSTEHNSRDKQCPKIIEERKKVQDKVHKIEENVWFRQRPVNNNSPLQGNLQTPFGNKTNNTIPPGRTDPIDQQPVNNSSPQNIISDDQLKIITEAICKTVADTVKQVVESLSANILTVLKTNLEATFAVSIEKHFNRICGVMRAQQVAEKEKVDGTPKASQSRGRSAHRQASNSRGRNNTPVNHNSPSTQSEGRDGSGLNLATIFGTNAQNELGRMVVHEVSRRLSPEYKGNSTG